MSLADMFSPHIPSGIRSLDPTSLLSFNIFLLTEGLVSLASLFSASWATWGWGRVRQGWRNLSDIVLSPSLGPRATRAGRWCSQDTPLPSQIYPTTTLPLIWLPMYQGAFCEAKVCELCNITQQLEIGNRKHSESPSVARGLINEAGYKLWNTLYLLKSVSALSILTWEDLQDTVF